MDEEALPHRALRKSQLIAFDNTAAGHEGVLSDKNGLLLVKPCKQAELDFYQTTPDHLDFKHYIPEFYGELALNQDATAEAARTPATATLKSNCNSDAPSVSKVAIIPASQGWVPTNGGSIVADSGIVLENVAHGFEKPNILDVKLGARLWADDAPPAKRQKLDKVADETTSRTLGFRVAGMKTWVGPEAGAEYQSSKGYKKYDKHYGKALKAEDVVQAFYDYFVVETAGVVGKLARKIIKRFLKDLKGLQQVIEMEESRMYSASLLFVYEGDGQALAEEFEREQRLRRTHNDAAHGATKKDQENEVKDGAVDGVDEDDSESDSHGLPALPKIQALKMIDFAHATWTPGQGPDENLLHGLRNVIKTLEELVE